jgi:hypothetical protein
MRKILFILSIVLSGSLFGQNYNKGLHIILQSVDTTYFDDSGIRWNEFSLTPRKYYRVMDLIESDTTCGCDVIKGNEHYIYYLKQNERYFKEDKKFHKKIIGYLECEMKDYELYMWISGDEAFGYIATNTFE